MRTNNNQQNLNTSNRKQLPPHLKAQNTHTFPYSASKIDQDSSFSLKTTFTIYCCNHVCKQANYFIADQSSIENIQGYCQRCAILLASQGINVTKIKQAQCNRKQQIQNFLCQIKEFQTQLDQKNNQIQQLLIGSQQFYGNQIQQVNSYFKIIYQSLQLEKNKCYNYILKQRQNAQYTTRNMKSRIQQYYEEIIQVQEDIQQSSQVIYDLDQKTYKPVIISYQNKLKKFQQETKQWQIPSIEYRKIQFVGVPEDLFSLSDIIQNICNKDKNESMMFSFDNNSGAVPGQSEQNLRNYLKMWD